MKAGAVTDDTEQAFVLARRLIDDNGCIDNTRYAHDLLQWEAAMKAKGSLDLLGPSTKAALQKLTEGVSLEETGRFGTTNGGAMRATPVGIGNWSPKASVLARVQYFMNWAETDGCRLNDNEFAAVLQRNCGTSVESNESVAAAFAIAARFFDDPTHALCFEASIGGDTDTIAAIAGAMLGAWHGMQGFDKTMLDQVLSQLAEDNHLDLVGTVTSLRALRDDSALNDVNIV